MTRGLKQHGPAPPLAFDTRSTECPYDEGTETDDPPVGRRTGGAGSTECPYDEGTETRNACAISPGMGWFHRVPL